jgi:hypothetical protein
LVVAALSRWRCIAGRIRHRQWPGDNIPGSAALHPAQALPLSPGLDTFGGDGSIELGGQADDGFDEATVQGIVLHGSNK